MNAKKQVILDYCENARRPVTAKEIINARYPDKQQPYINSDIIELINCGKLIRDDSCRPYTIRIPHNGEVLPQLKDYSRKKNSSPKLSNSRLPSDFKRSFNQFWTEIFNINEDYYSRLSFDDLVQLKMLISKVNNLLTYELSLLAASQISTILQLSTAQKNALIDMIETTDLNANGFDITFNESPKFVCEIKSTIPAGGKNRFGAAQDREIRKDIDGLLNSKEKSKISRHSLASYYKFMCFFNYNYRCVQSIEYLVRKLTSENNTPIEIWTNQMPLSPNKIYVLMIKPEFTMT